jgi:hypothetical protein
MGKALTDTRSTNASTEVANWYFWAQSPGVVLPRSIEAIHNTDERENSGPSSSSAADAPYLLLVPAGKRLLARDLFRRRVAEGLLIDTSPAAGTYYKAFLQKLFFATLNAVG